MHELSIAMSLVETACDKVRGLGDVHVDAVYVRIGPLSGVVKEALSFCFDVAARDSAIAGARLAIEDVPLVVFCSRCGCERQLAGAQHVRCPICDEPALQVVSGRELELTALEVSDRAPDR